VDEKRFHQNKKPGLQEKDRVWKNVQSFTAFPSKTDREAYSAGSSDSRISLLLAPSHPLSFDRLRIVAIASFVPDYSGVTVPESHGVPLGKLATKVLSITPFIP
jgi:hypothetical protein